MTRRMIGRDKLTEILQDHFVSEGEQRHNISRITPLVKAPEYPEKDEASFIVDGILTYIMVDVDDDDDEEEDD